MLSLYQKNRVLNIYIWVFIYHFPESDTRAQYVFKNPFRKGTLDLIYYIPHNYWF